MAEIIELGTRKFRAIEASTVEHDFTIIQLLAESGLDKVSKGAEESPSDYSMRILRSVMVSGKAFELLGAFLIPVGTPDLEWTPELGIATRQFVSKLTDPADKVTVRDAVAQMLFIFSMAGLFSWTDSPESSSEEAATPRPATQISETRSARGAISSGPSPAWIRPGTWRWLAALLRRLSTRTRKVSSATRATSTR